MNIKNFKIIVTGGAGFIGSNLVKSLANNNEVIVIDNLSTGSLKNIQNLVKNKKISFIKGSVTDYSLLERSFKNTDFVFHLAAIISIPFSLQNPDETKKVNIDGTKNVLKASYKNNVKKVVNSSSCAVYGNPEKLPITEETQINPLSPYALSKLEAEETCNQYTKTKNLQTISLRYFNVYGPFQNPKNKYAAVIPIFISKILKNKNIRIYGDGNQTRDFVFVEDIIKANILAALTNTKGVFNIGGNNKTSINELSDKIMDITNIIVKKEYVACRSGDIRDSYTNFLKAKEELNYIPKYNLKDGLEKTIKWYKNQKNI